MGYIVSVLVVMQIISFYLIFKKIRPIIIREKVKGIVLEPIPKGAKIEDVDGTNELVRNVMRSIIVEDWDVKIEKGYDERYEIKIKSKSNITVRCNIRLYDSKPYLSSFDIISSERGYSDYHRVSIGDSSVMKNEIITFMWDFILKFHEDENKSKMSEFNNNVSAIGSKLTAVNRDKKLKDLGI
jgi:hypothetical protein